MPRPLLGTEGVWKKQKWGMQGDWLMLREVESRAEIQEESEELEANVGTGNVLGTLPEPPSISFQSRLQSAQRRAKRCKCR